MSTVTDLARSDLHALENANLNNGRESRPSIGWVPIECVCNCCPARVRRNCQKQPLLRSILAQMAFKGTNYEFMNFIYATSTGFRIDHYLEKGFDVEKLPKVKEYRLCIIVPFAFRG